jgi:hypothetical protein
MKSTANRLYRQETRKHVRKAVLVIVAALQRCKTMTEASAKYKAAFTLLNSEHITDDTEDARVALLTNANEDHFAECKLRGCERDESDDHISESRRSIISNSPFTEHFKSVIRETDDENLLLASEDGELNELYSPRAFSVLARLMPYYPLWSFVVHERLPVDLPLSNATVESHFRKPETFNVTQTKKLTSRRNCAQGTHLHPRQSERMQNASK